MSVSCVVVATVCGLLSCCQLDGGGGAGRGKLTVLLAALSMVVGGGGDGLGSREGRKSLRGGGVGPTKRAACLRLRRLAVCVCVADGAARPSPHRLLGNRVLKLVWSVSRRGRTAKNVLGCTPAAEMCSFCSREVCARSA